VGCVYAAKMVLLVTVVLFPFDSFGVTVLYKTAKNICSHLPMSPSVWPGQNGGAGWSIDLSSAHTFRDWERQASLSAVLISTFPLDLAWGSTPQS
jgi:hypothetical protein